MEKRTKKTGNSKTIEKTETESKLSSLDLLLAKRSGGAQNFSGIAYQITYSCLLALTELSEGKKIRFEGIEDIDFFPQINHPEYIQLKSSKNAFDSHKFWELGVLQNFFEVYKLQPNSKFKLVHNTKISKGFLSEISSISIREKAIRYWKNKFLKSGIDISDVEFVDFLKSIQVIKADENTLKNRCLEILIKEFEISTGTEIQFFNALFNQVFIWAKERETIDSNNIASLFQQVKDAFSKHPQNLAIQNEWVSPVKFEVLAEKQFDNYYEGKAAKPIHIALDLPARRPSWEREVEDSVNKFDVSVIKASSGQGKSTLAWLVARTFLKKGISVYQINLCSEWDNVSHITDFIKSRLKIGEIPLVIVDGLDFSNKSWWEIASQLQGLSVKFIVTTREEDWYRYSPDQTKIELKQVRISLSIKEAEDVYKQLKNKGKIYSEINSWQPSWERVKEQGLLIEYVSLLTKGQMLKDRLVLQIKKLGKETGGVEKLEILRLIALSDTLSIKIRTSKLTEYIQQNYRFNVDRNEVYSQLEKEYYINFSNEFVTGLHPVRSKYLVEILHSKIPITESLLNLLTILDDEFIYDFFMNSASWVNEESSEEFYLHCAELISDRKYSAIVYSIDGLMHDEPLRYLKQNKEIFDEVSELGALDLFVAQTLPFTKLNTLRSLKETLKDKSPKLDILIEKEHQLTKYNINNSKVAKYSNALSYHLQNQGLKKEVEGLGFLFRWLKRLEIKIPLIYNLSEVHLLDAIQNKDINEAQELFSYFNLQHPEEYQKFIKKHKKLIISYLKKNTNSLTIEDKNNDIHINYLLDNNVEKANDFSVYRINVVNSFLPNYNHYCTEAIVLPYPDKSIYEVIVQASIKKMPSENVFDDFNVHINQIWMKVIESNYRCGSFFEWQLQYFKLREKGIEFAKITTRLFECHIENNSSRINATVEKLVKVANELDNDIAVLKKYPISNNKYFEKGNFEKEQSDLRSWCSSFSNFINQMSSIILPKSSNDRNVAKINLQDIVYKLDKMQTAYHSVEEKTFRYFQVAEIVKEESEWYKRLNETVGFYIYKISSIPDMKVVFAKEKVKDWVQKTKEYRVNRVKEILLECEEITHFIFYPPKEIIEENLTKTAVIGVENLDLSNFEEEAYCLISELVELSQTDIDYFTFIRVEDNKAMGAFRVNREFLVQFNAIISGEASDETSLDKILPVMIEEKLISVLEGVSTFNPKPNKIFDAIVSAIFLTWKLSEYRNRLDIKSPLEAEWLQMEEAFYNDEVNKELVIVSESSDPFYKEYVDTLKKFQSKKLDLDASKLVSILHKLNSHALGILE